MTSDELTTGSTLPLSCPCVNAPPAVQVRTASVRITSSGARKRGVDERDMGFLRNSGTGPGQSPGTRREERPECTGRPNTRSRRPGGGEPPWAKGFASSGRSAVRTAVRTGGRAGEGARSGYERAADAAQGAQTRHRPEAGRAAVDEDLGPVEDADLEVVIGRSAREPAHELELPAVEGPGHRPLLGDDLPLVEVELVVVVHGPVRGRLDRGDQVPALAVGPRLVEVAPAAVAQGHRQGPRHETVGRRPGLGL